MELKNCYVLESSDRTEARDQNRDRRGKYGTFVFNVTEAILLTLKAIFRLGKWSHP